MESSSNRGDAAIRGRRWRLRGRNALLLLVSAGAIAVGLYGGLGGLVAIPYACVGALLVARRPENRIGGLLLALGWVFALFALPIHETSAALISGAVAGVDLVVAVASSAAGAVLLLLLFAMCILFPTGRLPAGQARRPAQIGLIAMVVVGILQLFAPTISVGASDSTAGVSMPNPLALAPWLPVWAVASITIYAVLAFNVGGVVWMIVRLRRATGVEQAQLRWLVWSVAAIFVGLLIGLIGDALTPNGLGGLVWVPAEVAFPLPAIAIGFAVLRYRLYEIDLIIRRTAVYIPLTAILAGAYAASIALLQRLFIAATGDRSDGAIILSTLFLATIFTPVKSALQAAVDSRFRAAPEADRRVDDLIRSTADLLARPDEERVMRSFLRLAIELTHAVGGAIFVGTAREPLVAEPATWLGDAARAIDFAGVDGGARRLELGARKDGHPLEDTAVLALSRGAMRIGRAIARGDSGLTIPASPVPASSSAASAATVQAG
jgi:hypothetical protein